MLNKTTVGIAAGILVASCALTWYVTDLRWENKWQDRDLTESHQREQYQNDLRNTEHTWAAQFATIQTWYQQELENNRAEADKTIAAYRAGNLKLRKQFTCLGRSVSDTSTPGQINDAARDCGLQERDVEFLVRFAERAQAVVIKYNKAVKQLNIIYGENHVEP